MTETGLHVVNHLRSIVPTNTTMVKLNKFWEGLIHGAEPSAYFELYDGKRPNTIVHTATMTPSNTSLIWYNLPYRDDEGEVIDYQVREFGPSGFITSAIVKTGIEVDDVSKETAPNNSSWGNQTPAYIVTRSVKAGAPYVIWTLAHTPVDQRADSIEHFKQVAQDQGVDLGPFAGLSVDDDIIWLEGFSVSYDIYESEPDVGQIDIEMTFDAEGAITGASMVFQGDSSHWEQFIVGTYSAQVFTVTNTYAPADTELVLQGTKNLTGRDLKDGEFEFEIYPSDADGNIQGAVIETVTNVGNGFEFSPIPFAYSQLGDHYFVVVEKDHGIGGITYDKNKLLILAQVDDKDGQGNITIDQTFWVVTQEGTLTDVDALSFTNSYKASGNWTPKFTKELYGRTLEDNEFTFTLTGGGIHSEVGNLASGEILFDPIEYTQDDVGKVYTYTVKEVSGSENGMIYSDITIKVQVSVYDVGDGNLILDMEYEYEDPQGQPLASTDLTFVNGYTASALWSPEVEKILEGRNLGDDEFVFQLTGEGVSQQKTNKASGIVSFDPIEFTQDDIGKEYTYTLEELTGYLEGVTYSDEIFSVTVTIRDGKNGVLVLDTKYTDRQGETHEKATFTNIYDPVATYQISAEKILDGRQLEEGEFSFTIRDEEGNILLTTTNDADGKIVLPVITYTLDDVGKNFHYSIEEVPGDEEGMTYDRTVKEAIISVSLAENGSLYVTANLLDPTPFLNIYRKPGSWHPTAEKILSGRNLVEGEFTFVLKDEGGEDIERVQNSGDGRVRFTPIDYTYEDVGKTYMYSIEEVAGTEEGMVYDSETVQVKITVSEASEDSISVEEEYLTEKRNFENHFTAKDSVELILYKELKDPRGNPLPLGEKVFDFEVLEGDKVVATGRNTSSGEISFTPLEYTTKNIGKTYQYLVREVKGDLDKVTYTEEEITVEVKISETGNGQLSMEILYPESRTFVNTFEVDPYELMIGAKKELKGLTLQGECLTLASTKTKNYYQKRRTWQMAPSYLIQLPLVTREPINSK